MSHSESIEINASPETVWSLVTDMERYGEWSSENTGGYWRKKEDGVPGTGEVGDDRTPRRRVRGTPVHRDRRLVPGRVGVKYDVARSACNSRVIFAHNVILGCFGSGPAGTYFAAEEGGLYSCWAVASTPDGGSSGPVMRGL